MKELIFVLLFIFVYNFITNTKDHFDPLKDTKDNKVTDPTFENLTIYDNDTPIVQSRDNFDLCTKQCIDKHKFNRIQFEDCIEKSCFDKYRNFTGKSGISKCMESCDGYCVEYGITGRTDCYHNRYKGVYDHDDLTTSTLTNNLTNTNKPYIKYPALR
jgi:hypothetical protein